MKRVRAAWDRIRATKGLGRDVGIYAGIAVIGFGVAGFILIHQRVIWPWDHRVTYTAEFAEAPGVVAGQGQEVRIAGVSVGDIVGTHVTDAGRARITLSLKKAHSAVYDNAKLVLRPKSPLNEMYVLLDPGGPPGRLLKAGEEIPGVQLARPVQIEEVLGHLDDKARQALGVLLNEADTALVHPEGLSAGLVGADATVSALRPLSEALQSRRDKIATLVSALNDIAGAVGGDDARLTGLVDSARTTLAALAAHDGGLDGTLHQLPGFTDDLRTATAALTGLSGQLDPTLDQLKAASDRLPAALAGLTDVVQKAGTTVALAKPVVASAQPLVGDLRPFVDDARTALGDASPVTARLDPLTARMVQSLGDIAAAIYNGNSMFSVQDANGPLLRGLVSTGYDGDPTGWHYSSPASAREGGRR